MFKTRRQSTLIRLAELEKAHHEAIDNLTRVVSESEKLQKRAFLIDIQRDGKLNRFFFMRNGSVHVIETYGTLADNVTQWKKDLIE